MCPTTILQLYLLIDVLSDLDFPGGPALLEMAPALARNISRLKHRCRNLGIPAVYVNDNRGKWRSDTAGLIDHCLRTDAPARALVEPLMPLADDYIVLKPELPPSMRRLLIHCSLT
jgi:hypothetical protein